MTNIDDITGEKTFGLMDDLSFTYSSGLLTNVLESAEPDFGFKGAGGGFSYEYGRMTSGPGVTLIEYNELGLPSYVETASGDELTIRYDAEGKKWFQDKAWGVDMPEMYEDVQGMETKVYVNGLEAINGVVDVMYMEHGRVILAGGELERYEYFLKDHLGNNRVLFTDKDGNGKIDNTPTSEEVLEVYSYYPFGMLIEGMHEHPPLEDVYQPYKYNGKESLSANVYDYGARIYMPGIGRWNAVDPLAEKYLEWSGYTYTLNNPIVMTDPDGKAPISIHGDCDNCPGPGYYQARVNSRYIGFGIRHPIVALRIGFGVTPGATNISTNATRFATRGEVLDGSKRGQEDRGSENGAFRHGLWQAAISSEFGSSIAAQAGNAHEKNPFANLSKTSFSSLDQVDETVDMLNNIIGRRIGSENPGADMHTLANLVLDEFKNNGLYIASLEADGTWTISKTQLSTDKYNKLKNIYSTLNNDGRTQSEQMLINKNKLKKRERNANFPVGIKW